MTNHTPLETYPPDFPVAGEGLLENCVTPMAVLDSSLKLRWINPVLHDWLGAGPRIWRSETLAVLDAKPPLLVDAAARAFAQRRRVWLREARVRTAPGDRLADLAFTPLDANTVLLEVLPVAGIATSGLRLSESLRGFAHEVRGPLTGMRGAAQLLQRRADACELRELAALIVDEVDRLTDLSERLLHAGTKPRLVRVNVHEVIERVVALIAAGVPSLHVRRDYDPSLPPVSADTGRLQQALLNLARNAIQAGAGELILRTRAEYGARVGEHPVRLAVRIDIGDDGCGVPACVTETLFEPLVSGRADGSGIGLALAREIAREHGGDITYVSRPGATVFTLLLPVQE
ncbi:MAG: PAS domain-containing sensor histidine kinase [Rhodanobacter sp.]|jgi:two-component system nitrogen regulation sensor histidine kinase GlnL|nr:PAS domain-containing sensor histidine kinase [Rhodanobacter sp.]